MSQTIRFPILKTKTGIPAETSLVIDIAIGVNQLDVGGMPTYASLAPWKREQRATQSPFTCVAIEFTLPAPVGGTLILGNGTNPIGLFGGIILADGSEQKSLLGILGVNFAGTTVPQIPFVFRTDGEQAGFSQIVANVAAYDTLSVGGVTGSIVVGDGDTLDVRARPLFRRDWVG